MVMKSETARAEIAEDSAGNRFAIFLLLQPLISTPLYVVIFLINGGSSWFVLEMLIFLHTEIIA